MTICQRVVFLSELNVIKRVSMIVNFTVKLCCFLCQWTCVSPSLPQLIAIQACWCWSVAATVFSCLLIHKPKVVIIDCFISLSPSRDCGSVSGTCKDESSIMYAWARNAPPTKLPKGLSVSQSCFHSEEMWVSSLTHWKEMELI